MREREERKTGGGGEREGGEEEERKGEGESIPIGLEKTAKRIHCHFRNYARTKRWILIENARLERTIAARGS